MATPPTVIGGAGYDSHGGAGRPAPTTLAFALDFLDSSCGATIPAGNRLGVRIWASSSSGADLVVLYDHPLHPCFVQINAG